jgi:hypothetical protein
MYVGRQVALQLEAEETQELNGYLLPDILPRRSAEATHSMHGRTGRPPQQNRSCDVSGVTATCLLRLPLHLQGRAERAGSRLATDLGMRRAILRWLHARRSSGLHRPWAALGHRDAPGAACRS